MQSSCIASSLVYSLDKESEDVGPGQTRVWQQCEEMQETANTSKVGEPWSPHDSLVLQLGELWQNIYGHMKVVQHLSIKRLRDASTRNGYGTAAGSSGPRKGCSRMDEIPKERFPKFGSHIPPCPSGWAAGTNAHTHQSWMQAREPYGN